MEITKAVPENINHIMSLIDAAVKAMITSGLYQWDEHYPNQDIITEDIAAGSLFKISEKGKITGIIVLNEQYFPEYNALTWEDDKGRFLVVHRLCIHPDCQGKGLGKKLMKFAEEYALKNNYSSIRLDTFTKNQTALGLYDALGYRRAGEVVFTKGKFQCFEKVLVRG